MPPLTRWFIKAGFLYLLAALLLGIATQLPATLTPALGAIWPVYLHLLVVGWLTQFIFGVAWWLFPRATASPPRGSDGIGWAAFGLLNLGLLVRVVTEPAATLNPTTPLRPLLVVSAALQFAAGVLFVVNTWPRVKGK